MRRVFLLLSASLVMSLVLAPSAMAQGSGSGAGPEGEGPCTGTFARYIPEVNGCVTTEGALDPGQSIVTDADTGERIGTLDEVNAEIEAGETSPTNGSEQQTPELGDSTAAAYDPANYERSEINPNGPCFDPEIASLFEGTPVQDLALAYVNRNDPVGTPLVSPLDSDNDGIACNALTQADAQAIANGDAGNDQYGNGTDNTPQPAQNQQSPETPASDQYAEDTGGTGNTAEISVLPDTGGTPLWAIGAGAGLLLAAGGLLLKHRLS
jgi:hypothetical protein